MAGEREQRFVAIDRAEHFEFRIEFGQGVGERLQDQRVIVDDEDFHGASAALRVARAA